MVLLRNAGTIVRSTPPANITTPATTTATMSNTTVVVSAPPVTIVEISDDDDDDGTPIVQDRDSEHLRRERQMLNNCCQLRHLALQMEELERLHEGYQAEYRTTLPRAQLQQYDDAISENREEQYLISTICHRSRRTIPTTYGETDRLSRNV